jgi:hypothetical protein
MVTTNCIKGIADDYIEIEWRLHMDYDQKNLRIWNLAIRYYINSIVSCFSIYIQKYNICKVRGIWGKSETNTIITAINLYQPLLFFRIGSTFIGAIFFLIKTFCWLLFYSEWSIFLNKAVLTDLWPVREIR